MNTASSTTTTRGLDSTSPISDALRQLGAQPGEIQHVDPTAFGLNTTAPRVNDDIMVSLQVQPESSMGSADVVYLVAEVYQSVWNGGPPTLGEVSFFQLSGSTNSDGTMTWECIPGWDSSKTDPVPNRYLPANCRG